MGPPLPDGVGPVTAIRALPGGMIADVWRARLADGREVVLKATSYDARLEADGLAALGAAGAPVPEVLAADHDVLMMTFVAGSPDWGSLGERLAEMHRAGRGDTFGWHHDNVIGPLPQRNTPRADWASFYVEHRLRPRLSARALPAPVRHRLERAVDGPAQALLSHDAVPCLVHGDLWSGNVVDGAFLIDPAVHHADRELDLAFAEVFGGFPRPFWDAYQATWPLGEAWQRRRPVLQLFHLLVHVELFGAGYVTAVTDRLDRLGW
jgi:fructosamine-3-kinase